MKCPACGGPAKIVRETKEYVAIQCLNGHYRTMRKYGVSHKQKFFPVYIVEVEHQ